MIFRFILFVCIITFIQIGPSTATAHELNERLQAAIATEDVETVKNIIYQIKDIDSVRNWVGTPLHNAAFTRSLDIIKILGQCRFLNILFYIREKTVFV
jgi:hypothetical protein